MPGWVEHTIWWQVYPLGFVGAEHRALTGDLVVHRLPLVHSWLDYAIELGASGLALGPVFASDTHGYDTVDHFRVDTRLGDEADLVALFDAAHARGLRVLLDGVFNHVGRGHWAFRSVLEHGPESPTADWFDLSWPDNWQPGIEPDYGKFEGHSELVKLNHRNPAVVEHVTAAMNHWLERGADGWRLDAAYDTPPEFWSAVLPAVRAAHQHAYVVGEVIHGDYAEIVNAAGLDSVTQYELWKSIWSSLNDDNFFELDWTLRRHNGWLDTFVPLTFVGNHDVTRLASRLSDQRHVAHALVILLTIGGTPSIYEGDEQAFRGIKEDRAGGDDAIRPAFPDSPDELAGDGWTTYRLHQDLIGLRRRHDWLWRARTETISVANAQLCYRTANDGNALLVALNLSDAPASLPAPGATAVLLGAATLGTTDGRAVVTVAGHGWAILAA